MQLKVHKLSLSGLKIWVDLYKRKGWERIQNSNKQKMEKGGKKSNNSGYMLMIDRVFG